MGRLHQEGAMSCRSLLLSFVLVGIPSLVAAQNQPSSDPTALSYAQQSVAVMAGSATVTDVTLTGSVNTARQSHTLTLTATLLTTEWLNGGRLLEEKENAEHLRRAARRFTNPSTT